MNATANWFAGHWTWFQWACRKGILSWEVPVPPEEIEDLIQEYATSLIQRDGLSPYTAPLETFHGRSTIHLCFNHHRRGQVVQRWMARFCLRWLQKQGQDLAWRETMGARSRAETHGLYRAPPPPSSFEVTLEDKILSAQIWGGIVSDLQNQCGPIGVQFAHVLQRRLEGWSNQEISDEMGVCVSTVISLTYRARKICRKFFAENCLANALKE